MLLSTKYKSTHDTYMVIIKKLPKVYQRSKTAPCLVLQIAIKIIELLKIKLFLLNDSFIFNVS